jgi:2-oxoglutarate dehydrogenase E1 component
MRASSRIPSKVDADWRTFFEALAEERGDVLAEVRGASWAPNGARVIDVPDTEMPRAAANRNVKARAAPARRPRQGRRGGDPRRRLRHLRAFLLIRSYRIRGHLEADLDPLGLVRQAPHPELDPRPTASPTATGTARS